tara:strand:+ start:262 stop:375 length:114 start_codon:yes stop_codon:yes gene_type:complete
MGAPRITATLKIVTCTYPDQTKEDNVQSELVKFEEGG